MEARRGGGELTLRHAVCLRQGTLIICRRGKRRVLPSGLEDDVRFWMGMELEEDSRGLVLEEDKWLLVRKEALNVAAVMKQQPRFASAAAAGEHGRELSRGFSDIRRRVRAPLETEVMLVVRPFLYIVTSPDANGRLTSSALVALDKFIRLGVITTARCL